MRIGGERSREAGLRLRIEVPRDVLERLVLVPEKEWPFVLADEREVRYPVAWMQIRIGARAQPTIVVFGEPGPRRFSGFSPWRASVWLPIL